MHRRAFLRGLLSTSASLALPVVPALARSSRLSWTMVATWDSKGNLSISGSDGVWDNIGMLTVVPFFKSVEIEHEIKWDAT